MKHSLWFLPLLYIILLSTPSLTTALELPSINITLSQEEIDTILDQDEQFSYFGPEVCSLIQDFSAIKDHMPEDLYSFNELCALINDHQTVAPHNLIKAALEEIFDYYSSSETSIAQKEIERFFKALEEYYVALESGLFDIKIIDDTDDADTMITRNIRFKRFRTLQTRDLFTNYLTSRNATFNGTLLVNNSESISDKLIVLETLHVASQADFLQSIDITGSPQQGCIIFVDEAMNEKARICSSPIAGDKGVFISVDGGVTQNLRISTEGRMIIAPASSGTTLSVTGNSGASAITATGNGTTTAPALTLLGVPAASITDAFLTVDTSGIVKQTASGTNAIINGCQTGPITIGTNDATSLTLATNGCLARVSVDPNGAVTVSQPTSGEALTVQGNVVLPQTDSADDQGTLKLGGTAATRINVYQFGSRNVFAGSGTANTTVSGTDNISIGTNANSTLSFATSTIAIGSRALITNSNSIAVGNAAHSSAAGTITIGSTDSANTGAAPTASIANAIALGSASGTNAGATASGTTAIALGGAGGAIFTGAAATASFAIALGVNATANSTTALALGSSSGTAGGFAPSATNTTAIALGSAQGATRGANSSNTSSIAIGGSDGTSAGAAAAGLRSIALGLNANTAVAATGGIAIGSASSTGSLAPVASGTTAIALGSANSAQRGALSSTAASIAIGGSDGVSAGASASIGTICTAIGVGATNATSSAIILGNSTATAVAVGIGTSTPAAKLDIVGANGTPVIRLNQVTNAISNAPRWLIPFTSASAGTPIHYNASNQFFGFTSSQRYKTNIRPLKVQSEIVYQLRPVIYDAKEGYGEGYNIPGFIAEEVYTIAPDLVVLNSDGQPENVAYNSFHALVIKELQKHQQQLTHNATHLKEQETKLNQLIFATQQLQAKSRVIKNKKGL